jgi:hypothetical protein
MERDEPPLAVLSLIEDAGGKVTGAGSLPDGSGFATASFPLPTDHWLTAEGDNVPPMPMRIGTGPERDILASQVREAARYAIRASTMNGKEEDFDPDAMVQNFVVAMLGYWTPSGLSSVPEANPPGETDAPTATE